MVLFLILSHQLRSKIVPSVNANLLNLLLVYRYANHTFVYLISVMESTAIELTASWTLRAFRKYLCTH